MCVQHHGTMHAQQVLAQWSSPSQRVVMPFTSHRVCTARRTRSISVRAGTTLSPAAKDDKINQILFAPRTPTRCDVEIA